MSCRYTSKECLRTPPLATACTKRDGEQRHCCRTEQRRAWEGVLQICDVPFVPVGVIKPLLSPTWLPNTRVSLCPLLSALSQDKPQAQEPLKRTEHLSCEPLSFAEDVAGLPSRQGQKDLTPEQGSCLLVSD